MVLAKPKKHSSTDCELLSGWENNVDLCETYKFVTVSPALPDITQNIDLCIYVILNISPVSLPGCDIFYSLQNFSVRSRAKFDEFHC